MRALPVWALFLILAGLATGAGYAVLEPEHEAAHRSWMTSHFAVDYQTFGFVKRGLIGSLVDVSPEPAAAGRVAALSAGMLVLTLLAATAFVRQTAPPLALAVAFALSPGTFQNFAYDLGRFDQIGAALSLLSIMALRRGIPWLAPVAVLAGVLIHEAFTVMFLPLIVAVGLAEGRVGLWLPPALTGVASTTVVLLFGSAEAPFVADFFSAMGPDYYPPRIWTASFGSSVGYALDHALHPDTFLRAVVPSVGLLAANAIVLGRIVGRAEPRLLALIVFALAPVVLVAVGIDIPRWSAIAVFNLFTVALLVAREDESRSPWLLVALAGLAALGPVGIGWPFPLWLSLPG